MQDRGGTGPIAKKGGTCEMGGYRHEGVLSLKWLRREMRGG